nr:FaHV1S18_060 [Psittacid alphaherpesvirus 6]
MSEYPDRVVFLALQELSGRLTSWLLPKSLLGKFKRRNVGDTTMVFSLENGGLPLLSSVYVPWVLVWKSLCSRMNRRHGNFRSVDNDAFEFGDDVQDYACTNDSFSEERRIQKGLCLGDLDEAIARVCRSSGHNRIRDRPIISVECGPYGPYTLQLVSWCERLSVVVRTARLDVSKRSILGWMLAEAGMLGQYCAARLRMSADKVVFTATDCFVPRGCRIDKKASENCAYLHQPSIYFGRVAPRSKECYPGDVFVLGYMRVSGYVFEEEDIRAKSATIGSRPFHCDMNGRGRKMSSDTPQVSDIWSGRTTTNTSDIVRAVYV